MSASFEELPIPKQAKPECASRIAEIPPDIMRRLIEKVSEYDFESDYFVTNERSFKGTRRVVARNDHHKNKEQIYAPADFDDNLMPITQEVRDFIQMKVFPDSVPVLVQLAGLMPGQTLEWHIDTFLYQQYTNKVHIPIFTNPHAYYSVYKDGMFISKHLGMGALWNINNLEMHSSINNGRTKRVHLIMDYMDVDTFEYLEGTGMNYIHTPYPPAGQRMRQLFRETHEAATSHTTSPTNQYRVQDPAVAGGELT